MQNLKKIHGAEPLKSSPNFSKYVVNAEKVIFAGYHSRINECSNSSQHGSTKLIARVFKPSSELTADAMYLKLLRRIGKDAAGIVQSMDIFVDTDSKEIWLFQELANAGNGNVWVGMGNVLIESQLFNLVKAVYAALDFLGSLGCCHFSIHPKHIMLFKDDKGNITGKLSSFRDAIVYWDAEKKEIIYQKCLPADKFTQRGWFRAPEVFGKEDEVFNPLDADIFSLGATLFYMATATYPFALKSVATVGIDGEIRNSIASAAGISDNAKYFLFGLMRANTKVRTNFDAIPQDPFFNPQLDVSGNEQQQPQQAQAAPEKAEEKKPDAGTPGAKEPSPVKKTDPTEKPKSGSSSPKG